MKLLCKWFGHRWRFSNYTFVDTSNRRNDRGMYCCQRCGKAQEFPHLATRR